MDLNTIMQFLNSLSDDERVTLGLGALRLAAKGSRSAYKKLFSKKQKEELARLVRLASDDEIKHYAPAKKSTTKTIAAAKKAPTGRFTKKTPARKSAPKKSAPVRKTAKKTTAKKR